MFKKFMAIMLIVFVFGQVSAMKRTFQSIGIGELISLSKKMKTDSLPRENLFSLFQGNDIEGFGREARLHKLYGEDLNEKDSEGQTIFFVVDESKKIQSDEYFKSLADNGADINCQNDRTGMTVLSSAALDGDFKRIKRALDLGADPNIGPEGIVSSLIYLCGRPGIKFYPKQFEVINLLCEKTDVTMASTNGNNIMHARLLQRPIAERLLLNGADIDVLNAQGKKPREVCWVPETLELLESRKVVRDQVVMPAMYHIAASQDFKNRDNFPGMPQDVSKLVFNRQIIGPRDLNRRNLTFVGR
jgi:hypothetical protein